MNITESIASGLIVTQKRGMTSLEVAEVTGKTHAHVMRDIRNILKQGVSQTNFGLSSYAQEQPNGGVKQVPMYSLTPKGVLILASGYNAVLREKIVNRLEALEKDQAAQSYSAAKPIPQTQLQAEMQVASWAMNELRLSDVSRLHFVKQITDKVGLILPDEMSKGYVSSKGEKKSATELLKRFEIPMSALKFNQQAAKKGVLEQMTRKGSKGNIHKWWSITKDYLEYGENDSNEKNPLETTAHWYSDKFKELLSIIGIDLAE